MKQLLLLASLVGLLSGCSIFKEPASTPTPPIKEIVFTPCTITPVPKPEFPFDYAAASMTLFQKVQLLLADREVRIGYELKQEAALNSCEENAKSNLDSTNP